MPKAEAKYTLRAEDKTATGLRSAQNRLQNFGRFITTRILAPVLAVGAGIGTWVREAGKAQDSFAQLQREAAALSSTLEEAAAIQLGARILGTSPQEIRDIYETVAERIDDAAQGSKDVQENFARFGIDPESLRGLSAIETVARLSTQFRNLPRQQALSASSALLGEGRGTVLGQDVISAFASAGQLGLLRNLPAETRTAQEGVRSRAELEAVIADSYNRALNSPAAVALTQLLTQAIARPLSFGDPRDSGGTSIGQEAVRAQIRAARAAERAAIAQERAANQQSQYR